MINLLRSLRYVAVAAIKIGDTRKLTGDKWQARAVLGALSSLGEYSSYQEGAQRRKVLITNCRKKGHGTDGSETHAVWYLGPVPFIIFNGREVNPPMVTIKNYIGWNSLVLRKRMEYSVGRQGVAVNPGRLFFRSAILAPPQPHSQPRSQPQPRPPLGFRLVNLAYQLLSPPYRRLPTPNRSCSEKLLSSISLVPCTIL